MGTGREKPVLAQCLAHCREKMERVMGIEPTLAAWEAAVLPLNYTRVGSKSMTRRRGRQIGLQPATGLTGKHRA